MIILKHLFYTGCVVAFLQLVYSIWPLMFPLVWLLPVRSGLDRAGRLRIWLERVLLAWLTLALAGIYLFIRGSQSSLIPEPLNTLLFLGCGLIVISVLAAPSIKRTWLDRQLILQSRQISDLYLLSPQQFEDLIAAYFERYGYEVERSGRSGDHGIDLIIRVKSGEKWVVQCKRWKTSVGEPVVRDLFGVMHHEGASRAFLMTTGTFTPAAISWVQDKPITLYDGPGLIRLLRRFQRKIA